GEALSLESIRDFVAQTLPRHCAPRQLIIVESLPRTSLGKVMRRSLADALASQR
ncbi:MAG: AMP-binding enzyme C-terminal domain, partial [Actinomycetota bacterium]